MSLLSEGSFRNTNLLLLAPRVLIKFPSQDQDKDKDWKRPTMRYIFEKHFDDIKYDTERGCCDEVRKSAASAHQQNQRISRISQISKISKIIRISKSAESAKSAEPAKLSKSAESANSSKSQKVIGATYISDVVFKC